jgi:hypothetical protein
LALLDTDPVPVVKIRFFHFSEQGWKKTGDLKNQPMGNGFFFGFRFIVFVLGFL